MPTVETIETLQATLEPFGTLQEEHSHLEEWVHNSFEALEKLHEDLAAWQTELARKQTELDLREDALEKCQSREQDFSGEVAELQSDLVDAKDEIQQLEEEGAEQLQELENLERQHVVLKKELKTANQHVEERTAALEAERFRAADEQHQWRSELKEIRLLMEKKFSLLAEPTADDGNVPEEEIARVEDEETTTRSAKLRQRAKSRLAAKRRRQQEKD